MCQFFDGESKLGFQAELGKRERAMNETRIRTLQEMEELKKICCIGSEKNSTVENG